MNILALDLGTKTGWAMHHAMLPNDDAGTWSLASRAQIVEAIEKRMDRRQDPRFVRLLIFIKQFRSSFPNIDWIVFEDVEFVKSRMQAHLWATWRAAIWCQQGVNIDCLSTGKLKAFATGSGSADKDKMARALTMDPRYILDKDGVKDTLRNKILDDNAVDAVHLLNWAKQTFK
jgi:hypothetical protein